MQYMYTMDYYSALKNCHWNYETMPLVATEMDDEEGLTITKSASQGKTIVHYLPSMQNEKRGAMELIYNIKRDSEIQTQRIKKKTNPKTKGPGMN